MHNPSGFNEQCSADGTLLPPSSTGSVNWLLRLLFTLRFRMKSGLELTVVVIGAYLVLRLFNWNTFLSSCLLFLLGVSSGAVLVSCSLWLCTTYFMGSNTALWQLRPRVRECLALVFCHRSQSMGCR